MTFAPAERPDPRRIERLGSPRWPKGMAPPWVVVTRLVPGRAPFEDFVALKRLGEEQGVAIWGSSWPRIERVRDGDAWRPKVFSLAERPYRP